MRYTAYTEREFGQLPKIYRKQVIGIKEGKEVLQVPLCPMCGGEMMEDGEYLSCLECCETRKKRIIKE